MEIVDSTCTSLRGIGKDGHWVREWILEQPSRVGLGPLEKRRHEFIHCGDDGNRLEILAFRRDMDTFYDIKILLDECDSDHGLGMLNYWLRERSKYPDTRYVAVLVGEALSSKCGSLLDGLPQVMPFIGIEIKVLTLSPDIGMATIVPSIIVQSHHLKIDEDHSPDPVVENDTTIVISSVLQNFLQWRASPFSSGSSILEDVCLRNVEP